jgi:sugar phosphate isomerase/epimerase
MKTMKNIEDAQVGADRRPDPLRGRLGLNVPAQWWPTAPALKALEAAGFSWVQLHSPPRSVLTDAALAARHAAATRGVLTTTGLRAVIHAPDELLAGTPEHDGALAALVDYATIAGAEIVVYHGRNIAPGQRAAERALAEERSLRQLLPRLAETGVTLAIENLAPVYPGGAALSYAPGVVAELVDRLGLPNVGMCFDIGHAHIAAAARSCAVLDLLEPLADRVALFHVHDNLGDRRRGDLPGVDPIRLDLHLPPGRGTVAWEALAPVLAAHRAPLQLEIHPSHRPTPMALAEVTMGLLSPRGSRRVAAA